MPVNHPVSPYSCLMSLTHFFFFSELKNNELRPQSPPAATVITDTIIILCLRSYAFAVFTLIINVHSVVDLIIIRIGNDSHFFQANNTAMLEGWRPWYRSYIL